MDRPSLVGARVLRREDDRLLTGAATYVGDIRLPRMAEAVFVRSPFAHARIGAIDTTAAMEVPGVLAIYTARDLVDVTPFPDFFPNARPVASFPLCRDRALHLGAPVAVIVAQDRYVAEDGAELVTCDYEELQPITSCEEALDPNAPILHAGWADNRLIEDTDPRPEVDDIFDRVTHVVAGRYTIQRHAAVPIETRGAVASFEAGRLTLWTATQFPHIVRTTLSYVLPIPERDIRVIAPDVGGGFGGKCQVYAEEVVVAWLALHLRRPIRYLEDRAEHMVASVHARDEVVDLEAAVEPDGRINALRGSILQDAGSGETFPAGFCPAFVLRGSLTGPYRIPHQRLTVTSVVTNKTPSGAYRGFGMPEATFAMERLVDRIAAQLGLDPVQVRERNMIASEDLPYITASGARIDSGSHLEAMQRIVKRGEQRLASLKADLDIAPSERLGIGYANYVEGTVGSFFSTSGHWTSPDSCNIRFDPDGGVVVAVGVSTAGQGLETMVAMLAAETLSVPIESVRVVMGDTDQTPYGLGGWGSRSLGVAAGAISAASEKLTRKGRAVAGHLLETAPEDVVLDTGGFHPAGSPDKTVTWGDVCRSLLIRTVDLPADIPPGLEENATYDPPNIAHVPDERGFVNSVATHTNSTHAAIVKVDTESGEVRVLDYLVAHDCGVVLNRNMVEGQIHGGVAQGIGGCLFEEFVYDSQGQLLTGSFMDYLLPLATDIPPISVEHIESPAPEMPFGVKGAGEAGVIGPAAAISTAIENALQDLGVVYGSLDTTPYTPQVIQRLIMRAVDRSPDATAPTRAIK